MPKRTKERHIAIYIRVSKNNQKYAAQLPDLERWAAQQDEPIVWYQDKQSGKSKDKKGNAIQREAWDRLQQNMNVGLVSKVVVWRIDRLGRTVSKLSALFEEMIERKINLVSLRDNLDLSTAAGRLMANVLASVAQYETELRGERIMEGIEDAKAKRKAKGQKMWGGSKKGDPRRKKVKPETVETIKHLLSLGTKKAKIARTVGLSRQSVYTVIREHGLSS